MLPKRRLFPSLLLAAVVGGFVYVMGTASMQERNRLLSNFVVGVASGAVVLVLRDD